MIKVFLVSEVLTGFREKVVGICPTTDLAEQLATKVRNSWDLEDCEITTERFSEMVQEISWESGIEPFIEHFPEYSVSDIERAVKYYTTCPFLGCIVREIDHFMCYDDILNYGIDH